MLENFADYLKAAFSSKKKTAIEEFIAEVLVFQSRQILVDVVVFCRATRADPLSELTVPSFMIFQLSFAVALKRTTQTQSPSQTWTRMKGWTSAWFVLT